MASLHELTAPIPEPIPEHMQELLKNLQGNILHGHGRDKSVHIFLRFNASQENTVKQWINSLAKDLTSAQQQLEEAKQYREKGIPGRLFVSFFLSAKGYEYLDPTLKDKLHFNDKVFLSGMKASRHRLNDPPEETWEEGYRNEIHAMVLLADDDESALLREAQQQLNHVKSFAEICAVEHGRLMRNAQGYGIEHFGYTTGHSQPLFFQEDINRARQAGNGMNTWDPGAGPNLVLAPDPYGVVEVKGMEIYQHSGSYLVFRKLEQNVRAFKERERDLAMALGLDEKRAGALVMGRFDDGTPVVLQSTGGRPSNNFIYDLDPNGEKCPLQAHIRKVNPRQKGIKFLRLVRRGITYGQREKEPKDNPRLEQLPSAGIGLLFMCFQRNIEKQFEVLQHLLANDPCLPHGKEPGIDPVIGQPGRKETGLQRWPAQWGEPRERHRRFNFQGFVTLKGGEYFFAPSIYFVKNIQELMPS